MISPTGKGIRVDKMGDGNYGTKRGARMHLGGDYECEPGQDVVAPISGKIIREARPYLGSPFSGVLIQGEYMSIKMFYFVPCPYLIGDLVVAGQVIGTAQNIAEKYGPEMIPHVHVRINSINPEIVRKLLAVAEMLT